MSWWAFVGAARAVKISTGETVMHERISIDPQVCHGQACVKGTRIPVRQIVRMLTNGDRVEDLLEEYPSITREDVLACLDYAGGRGLESTFPPVVRK